MKNRITTDGKDSLLRVDCFLPQSSGALVILLLPKGGFKVIPPGWGTGEPEARKRALFLTDFPR
jgi:hypothetical protein